MTEPRIAHVGIAVPRIADALPFYRDILGLTPRPPSPNSSPSAGRGSIISVTASPTSTPPSRAAARPATGSWTTCPAPAQADTASPSCIRSRRPASCSNSPSSEPAALRPGSRRLRRAWCPRVACALQVNVVYHPAATPRADQRNGDYGVALLALQLHPEVAHLLKRGHVTIRRVQGLRGHRAFDDAVSTVAQILLNGGELHVEFIRLHEGFRRTPLVTPQSAHADQIIDRKSTRLNS